MTSEFGTRLLRIHLKQLERHVERNGVKGLENLYKEARGDIYDALRAAGPTSQRATPSQLRVVLDQLEMAIREMSRGIFQKIRDTSRTSAEIGAKQSVDEYEKFSKRFRGTTPIISLDRAAIMGGLVSNVDSSLLRRHRLVSGTWAARSIENIERILSVGTLAGKSIDELTDEVVGREGLLQEQRWMAERVVRTENAYAHGVAKYTAMERTQEEVGPLWKKLIETFDDRTGDDSFLQHGQTVPMSEPFVWSRKRRGGWVRETYMHPPNRPNDRAVMIPWDPSWEEAAGEKPLTKGQLAGARTTRWRSSPGVDVPTGHKSYPYGRPVGDDDG